MRERVLVAGTGVSGISSAKLLIDAGGEVLLFDENTATDINSIIEKFTEYERKKILIKTGKLLPEDINDVCLCIISPGIPLESEFVTLLNENNIQIWSELQLAYHRSKGKMVAITGTNGKTTTTSLLYEIVKASNGEEKTFVAGNIGLPFTEICNMTEDDSISIIEASSFQLETIISFRPDISIILNVTPDHLDRHHSMENYLNIKKNIALNQTEDDVIILNYEDDNLRQFGEEEDLAPKVVFFSSKRELDNGLYLRNEKIFYKKDGVEKEVVDTRMLILPGIHNYENVMAAAAAAIELGVDIDLIANVCKKFKSVEHRIEFVASKFGVKYYNDSKGTNPDAAITALKAMKGPTLLIAGGYDKKADYNEWTKLFNTRLKYLILIGQTRNDIARSAKINGFDNIMFAEDLSEAVKVCSAYAVDGDNVLLSPGCASWDMFKDYKHRGNVFKDIVNAL